MNINTKYNIEDIVYTIIMGKVVKIRITMINIIITKTKLQIFYSIWYDNTRYERYEEDISDNYEELKSRL